MRASYGMSYLPLGGTGGLVTVRQNGYSRSTPYVSTSGGGANSYIPNLPGNSTWDNPVPERESCNPMAIRWAHVPSSARASLTTTPTTRFRACTSSTPDSSTNCPGGRPRWKHPTSAAARTS